MCKTVSIQKNVYKKGEIKLAHLSEFSMFGWMTSSKIGKPAICGRISILPATHAVRITEMFFLPCFVCGMCQPFYIQHSGRTSTRAEAALWWKRKSQKERITFVTSYLVFNFVIGNLLLFFSHIWASAPDHRKRRRHSREKQLAKQQERPQRLDCQPPRRNRSCSASMDPPPSRCTCCWLCSVLSAGWASNIWAQTFSPKPFLRMAAHH